MAVITIVLLFLYLRSSSAFAIKGPFTHNLGIYHGTPISITKVPFLAIYRPRSESYHCAAAIVHEKYLVTAAHCYKTCDADKYVTVGTDRINGTENYEIETTFVHPKYVHDDIHFKPDYDIAVVKLKKKLVFSDQVQPIAMAEPGLVLKAGETLTAMGFGLTESGRASPKLLSVDVPYIDQEECKKDYQSTEYKITDRMLCAGAEGAGSCNFDSGGPITYKGVFVGITSGGNACGSSEWPVFYTRVSALRSFIDNIISKK